MIIQRWIHSLEVGAGARLIKTATLLLGFVAFAVFYNLSANRSFTIPEAMEAAQLARNLSEGKGYTTFSIRPLDLYLLQRGSTNRCPVLSKPVPDLTHPPVYPAVLAGLMKVLPFRFAITDPTRFQNYQPELCITTFNQVLFFLAVVLLFTLARRLFDPPVAWAAAIIFAATELFWKFSLSGLSTMLLLVIFLALAWCLVLIEERARAGAPFRSLLWAAIAAGVLLALGSLTRYAFAWLIVPTLLFIGLFTSKRFSLCLTVGLVFLSLMAPWLARNSILSGNCLGTAGYTIFQETVPFPGDRLERSLNPEPGLSRIISSDFSEKLFVNAREILQNDLPKLGGNWVSAFFLVGLLVPFRSVARSRMRIFLVVSLLVLIAAQGLGRTHLTSDSPEINSENLVVVLAPLVFAFGAALFFTLLQQFEIPLPHHRLAAVACFIMAMCAPLLLTLITGPVWTKSYCFPPTVQQTARWMAPSELTMSDIPEAMAWYGDRPCLWLPLNDREEFARLIALGPVKAIYLTERTTDSKFISQMLRNPHSWEQFALQAWVKGEVPAGFPLRKAPTGFLPRQFFLSDHERWR